MVFLPIEAQNLECAEPQLFYTSESSTGTACSVINFSEGSKHLYECIYIFGWIDIFQEIRCF